jgi:hypothetical protein
MKGVPAVDEIVESAADIGDAQAEIVVSKR